MRDLRIITGSNLRSILLTSDKQRLPELYSSEVDIEYFNLEDDQFWKIDMVKKIIDVLQDEKTIDGIGKDELTEVLDLLCTGSYLLSSLVLTVWVPSSCLGFS